MTKAPWEDPEGEVKELAKILDNHSNHKCCKIVEKIKAALSIYKENEFSREFMESLLK